MPNFFLSSDSAIPGVPAAMAADFGAITVISADATIVSYNSNVVNGFGDNQNVTVAGAAVSNFGNAIFLSGDNAIVQVLASGQVSNTNIQATAAVYMEAPGSTVVNQGLISGGTGVELNHYDGASGTPSQVINHGTISGNGFGYPGDMYSTASFGAGIFIDGGNWDPLMPDAPRDAVNIVNTGLVSGAIRENGQAPGYSILLQSTESQGSDQVEDSEFSNIAVHIVNSGQLMGRVKLLSADDVLENSGEIHGDVLMGGGDDLVIGFDGVVQGVVYGQDGDDTVFGGEHVDLVFGGGDDDEIFGMDGDDVLAGSSGDDYVRGGAGNDEILGDSGSDELFGGSGNDAIDGGSSADVISGDSGEDTIIGGTGDDTINGGSGEDDIAGGLNNDQISGGSGDDLLRGEDGNDALGGGAGEDTLSGNAGDDSMDGGSGDDRMFGGADNDRLEGTTGNDYLDGGSGNDEISGGSDNDTIIGGTGQDTMSGGWGADVFVFTAIADSPTGVATRDTITDFETGVDLIDLSDIASGLTFVNAFTGTAGEVRYNESIGRLYIDIDGDSASDFQLDLGAGTVLTEDDLIF